MNVTSVPVSREWSSHPVPIVTGPFDAIATKDTGEMNLNISFVSGFECISYNIASFDSNTVLGCMLHNTHNATEGNRLKKSQYVEVQGTVLESFPHSFPRYFHRSARRLSPVL